MWELDCEESWVPQNWCVCTVVLEKTLERSNQSILKDISPGISLEGMMLKLKFQYFGHLMLRVDSLEKTLMLGGIGGRRRRGWQRMRWLDGITDSMDVNLSELQELVLYREAWRAVIHGVTKSQTGLRDWTELNWQIDDWLYLWCSRLFGCKRCKAIQTISRVKREFIERILENLRNIWRQGKSYQVTGGPGIVTLVPESFTFSDWMTHLLILWK